MPDNQIGVLIDYENVGLGAMRSLFDQLSDLGRIIVRRAYADWSRAGASGDRMLELGIEARHYFRASGSGKNASDISLAIDAIELLYSTPVDTFVIVSSDTDFLPLVSKLRAAGKQVVGAGRRGVVSPALVQTCDRYIFLDEGEPTVQDHSQLQKEAEALVVRAIGASVDDQDQVVSAKLHNTIRRMDPSFDFRPLGHKSFTTFLESLPSVKLQRSRGRGDTLVELVAADRNRRIADSIAPEAAKALEWDDEIDVAWSGVGNGSIAGSKAAAEAAKVLGVSKISVSRYKNLQGLLDASEVLRARWLREGNSILRKQVAP